MNAQKETTNGFFDHWRYWVVYGLMAAVFGFFIFRLFTLQIIDGEVYAAQAEENRTTEVSMQTSRGLIYDRNGFVLARKPGKLPCETMKYEYGLEYGTDVLEIHKDAIKPGQKVVIVDDLLATGGTALATIKLVEQAGGEVVGVRFAIELCSEFDGRAPLKGYDVQSVMQY